MEEFRTASDGRKMELNPNQISKREKLILVGMYLSKYDKVGLSRLGCDTFVEAFNLFGYAIGSRPGSVKNYRDEFDPLFPNRRKGWHKRQTRDYCLKVFEEYRKLDIESFTGLIRSFVDYDENAWSQFGSSNKTRDGQSSFVQRLITGLAAEQYFESVRSTVPQFKDYTSQNTTKLGCGYDFRLETESCRDFLAVEVKGLKELSGSLLLTPKEHRAAKELTDRFFLFVVKNFRESPCHEIFQNPLSSRLQFRKNETVTIQVSWLTTV